MKTTIDIPEPLLRRAKRIAARERTTVRALVEEGLRDVIGRRSNASVPFQLRDASFRGGRGLQPEFADGRWDRILDAAYEGHGA